MKVCKTEEVSVMIDQRINSCLTFCQGKCPHFTITERFFLFPQILNAIDIELAEGNCLDCEKYVDRRVSQQSRSGRRDAPSKESDYGAQNEKRQHGRTAVRLPIHILAADGSRQGETEDISLGGAFIRCEKRVVWTNLESQGSSNKPIGMGVEFL
jgi:hypothetical protein